MTPAEIAAAFEDAQLGVALAFVAFAIVVALIVRHEWIASQPDRDARRRVKP